MKNLIGIRYIITYSILLLGVINGCKKKDNQIFEEPSSIRFEKAKEALSSELQASEYGWKLVYFPATAENLSSVPSANTNFTFLFKFIDEKSVQMKSSLSTIRLETSEYKLTKGTSLQLEFVTYNIIHDLANAGTSFSGLGGKARDGEFQFLYYGKKAEDLIFRTNRNNTEILFEKATAEDWTDLNKLSSIFNGDFKSTVYALRASKNGVQFLDSIAAFNTSNKTLSLQTKRINANGTTTKVETKKRGFGYGTKGLIIMPAIEIKGKSFYFFEWDAVNKKIISKNDDYTVEIEPTTDPKFL